MASATQAMASEGHNFQVVIEKQPGDDYEIAPEEAEEIQPDHYYEDGGIPVFKPVSLLRDPFVAWLLAFFWLSSRWGSVVPKEVNIAGCR
jgi:hypothetical protein